MNIDYEKNFMDDIVNLDINNVNDQDTYVYSRNIIEEKNKEIVMLKQNIKYRDITINIYRNLIESKFGIKLKPETYDEDIVIHSNNNFKYTKKNTKIKEQSLNKKVKKKSKNIKNTSKTKTPVKNSNKRVYINKKKIPKSIVFTKEKTEIEIQKLIKEKDEQFIRNTSPTKMWSYKKQDHLNIINETIDALKNNTRSYSKELVQIKTHRLHLLRYLSEDDYKKLVFSQCENIKQIFKSRGKDDKKIKTLVRQKIIGAYEHRMLFLEDFEKTTIEIDELELLKNCYENKFKFETNFIKFSIDNLVQNICNYQICITDILSIISNTITNVYGFYNIVYLPFDNNNYAFYYLESVNKTSRKWIMDCQLDDISSELWDKIYNYSISVFKTLYQKIYHDNQYRSDFIEVSQVMELEGIQLLKNLLYLSNQKQFVTDFQEIIKTCNNYVPSEVDSFNLFTNDPLLKVKYQQINKNKLMKQIFDNINQKEIDELYLLIQK